MTLGGGSAHRAGRTAYTPVSSCQLVIDVSGGNAQREIYSSSHQCVPVTVAPVFSGGEGRVHIGPHGSTWVRRKPRTWNQTSVRGYTSKKQCCDRVCVLKREPVHTLVQMNFT